MRKLRAVFSGMVLSWMLGACAVGPDYRAPHIPVADEFANLAGVELSGVEQEFWKSFQDPMLDELVERALAANHEVRIALARLREARAVRGEAQLDLMPTTTVRAGHTEARTSERTARLPNNSEQSYYQAGFDTSWELDVFGGVQRNLEARTALLQSAAASVQTTQVSVTAEVARNYLELRGLQERLQVARRNAANQQESLDLTSARLEVGRGTQLDVARARAQLDATRSTIPDLEAQSNSAMLRLSVLTGELPGALLGRLETPRALPQLPAVHGIGTPESLLRRRPDVRSAERELAAATARVGIAIADLFPRISFTGSWGFDAADTGDLTHAGSESYGFGPSIRWAAFDLGRVRQRIRQREAASDGALARYEQTVLRALQEADDALTAYAKARSKQQYLESSAAASAQAAQLARARFDNGVADFFTVLDTERTRLEAEDRRAQGASQAATSLLAMYKALGGGFRPLTATH
jgi:multidrug efflux system outer membrane protein